MAIRRKRGIVVSRLKALVSVIDSFDRLTSLSLGTVSGAPWTQVRGSWGVTLNKAISGDSPSTYPLATLTFSKEDVTLSVDGVGPGVGTAFWVTDSGNWWGSVVDGVQSCQTCYNAATCQQFFNCCNGNTNPVVPGNPFTACIGSTNPVVPGNFFSCCTGNINAVVPGNFFSCCIGTTNPVVPGNPFTQSVCTAQATYGNIITFVVNYACGGPGNSAPGSSCGLTFAQAQACGGCKRSSYALYNNGQCTAWTTQSGTNPSTGGNCNQSGTCQNGSSGGNCNQFGTCQNAATGGNCNQFGTAYNASTGGNCNAFAFNCCSQYAAGTPFSCNCVVNNKVNIIKSVAGTISTVATFSYNSTIAGFRTILNGNSVTVRAFSGSGYQSQIGSDQSTTISGYTKSKKHGILKGPATFADAQSSEINEFRVS